MKKFIDKFFNINKNKELIREGNLYKGIILVALPLMLSNLVHTIYNLVDMFWVTKISVTSNEVASVTLVFPIIMLMLTIGMGLGIGASTLISQYIGARDSENANKVVSQLVFVSMGLGILAGVLLYFSAKPVVTWMVGDEIFLIEDSVNYLKVIAFQTPLFFLFSVFQASKQGQGDTITPLLYIVVGNLINMVLDPLFILTFDLGVVGAALATVLAKVIYLIPVIKLFTDKSSVYVDFKYVKPDPKFIRNVVAISLPLMISQSMSSLGFMVLNRTINSYGANVFTAFSVGNRITSVFMMPVMGLGAALATFIGVSLGADNIKRAKEAFKTSTILAVGLGVLFTVILISIRQGTTSIFINPKDAITYNLSNEYLIFVAINLPLMGIFQNLQGVFNGSGHTKFSLIITASRLWVVRLPIIYIASRYLMLEHQIIWWAMLVSNVIIVSIGLIIYKTGIWEKKVI